MYKKYLRLLQVVILLLVSFSSCRSIRQSTYIEKKFLLAKLNDKEFINTKMPYDVVLSEYISTSYKSTGGSHTSKWSSIDIYINDTINNVRFLIDDRKSVFNFLENNPNTSKYYQEFKQRKTAQKIHRYTSLTAMASGIFLLSKMGDDANYTKQETRYGNSGAYLFIAGFLNWIGGGFGRAIIRRKVPMKAMYAYYFGDMPNKIPKISKQEKKQIMKGFNSF